jgi:hypothetical protein
MHCSFAPVAVVSPEQEQFIWNCIQEAVRKIKNEFPAKDGHFLSYFSSKTASFSGRMILP